MVLIFSFSNRDLQARRQHHQRGFSLDAASRFQSNRLLWSIHPQHKNHQFAGVSALAVGCEARAVWGQNSRSLLMLGTAFGIVIEIVPAVGLLDGLVHESDLGLVPLGRPVHVGGFDNEGKLGLVPPECPEDARGFVGESKSTPVPHGGIVRAGGFDGESELGLGPHTTTVRVGN